MSDEEILFEVIECMGNTQVGHIKLNAPRTLNSLTLRMVKKYLLYLMVGREILILK